MDALLMLEFPSSYFDLVNQRFATSWLRIWEWSGLLVEYQRVTRPGGIIRITEPAVVESNSPALTQLCRVVIDAWSQSGRFFARTTDGGIVRVASLMREHRIEQVQTQDYFLVYQAGTEEHHRFCEDMQLFFRVAVPFLQKWTRLPDNYQDIYTQALIEMQQPGFVATWHLLTAWGMCPAATYSLGRGLR
jgi:ubiquinone/menaquinone biosynthesis C-methylase UbiE